MTKKTNLRRTSGGHRLRTKRKHRSNTKDVIRRIVAPNDMDPLEGKGERTPCGLPSAAKFADIPDARLSQAEMGRKSAGKQGHVVAIGDFIQQGLMQRFDRGGRFGNQVEGGAAA